MSGLTEKQKENFEKFKICQAEIADVLEIKSFKSEFAIVTRFMVEVITSSKTE